MPLINEVKHTFGIDMKYAKCNNIGKKDSGVERACKQEEMGVQFEYIAFSTLQQNCRVERTIVTLFNRVCAILNGGFFFFLEIWTMC